MDFNITERRKKQNTSFYALRKRLEVIIHHSPTDEGEQKRYQEVTPMHIHLLSAETNSTVIYSQNPDEYRKSPEDVKKMIGRYEETIREIFEDASEGSPGTTLPFDSLLNSAIKNSSKLKDYDLKFAATYFSFRGQPLSDSPSVLESVLITEFEAMQNDLHIPGALPQENYPSENADFLNADTAAFILAEYLQFRPINTPIHDFLINIQDNRITLFILPFRVLNQFRSALVVYCKPAEVRAMISKLRDNYKTIVNVLEAQASQIVLGTTSFALQFDMLAQVKREESILRSLSSLWFCSRVDTINQSGERSEENSMFRHGKASSLFKFQDDGKCDTIILKRDRPDEAIEYKDKSAEVVILDALQLNELKFTCPLRVADGEVTDGEKSNGDLTLSYLKVMADSVQSLKELSTKNLQGEVNSIFALTTKIYQDTLECMGGLSSFNNPLSLAMEPEQRLSCINHLAPTCWALAQLATHSEKKLLMKAEQSNIEMNLFAQSSPSNDCVEFWVNYFSTRGFYQIAANAGKAHPKTKFNIKFSVGSPCGKNRHKSLSIDNGKAGEFPEIQSINWDIKNLWPLAKDNSSFIWSDPGLCFLSGFPLWYLGKITSEELQSEPIGESNSRTIELGVKIHCSQKSFSLEISGASSNTVTEAEIVKWQNSLQSIHKNVALTRENNTLKQIVIF